MRLLFFGTYHDLFNLREVVDGVDVQSENAERLQRGQLLWDDLRGIEDVESKGGGLVLVDHLDIELPFREIARLNGIPEILAVIVGVLPSDVLSFIPDKTGLALLGLEVPLDKFRLALVCNQAIGVYAETVL